MYAITADAAAMRPSNISHQLLEVRSRSSLILRHPLRRRSITPRSTRRRPSMLLLLPAMHHDRSSSSSRVPINLLLHVRAVLDVLAEMADVAADLLVRLERKRDQGHEAEGEPFPALGHAAREIAAVLALHRDVLGAGEGAVEDCGGWG
jgi:hypothetical protein